jgi:hypothetical protein
VTITATEDDTNVVVRASGSVAEGAGISTTGDGTVKLSRGDVLEVVSSGTGDLSGTRVRADKPVQVLSGHSCANVPTPDAQTCDHIEEVAMPEETLGSDYYVTIPKFADVANQGGTDAPYVLRVLPLEPGTRVTFDPAIVAPQDLSPDKPFEHVFVEGKTQNVRVTSTKPVLVAMYLMGYSQLAVAKAALVGDPSLSIAVPVEQYRKQYLFTAPLTYNSNIASIIAPKGASVRVDGKAVDTSGMTMIGKSSYGVVHVLLSSDSGVHTLEASMEVGLSVYGYGAYTSYMYPGGVDLKRITVPPVL